jgi:hypothetical protein
LPNDYRKGTFLRDLEEMLENIVNLEDEVWKMKNLDEGNALKFSSRKFSLG